MDERSEMDAYAYDLIIGGGCFGAALGWAACAAWRGDWQSLSIVLIVLIAFLAYRHYRIARSIGSEARDV